MQRMALESRSGRAAAMSSPHPVPKPDSPSSSRASAASIARRRPARRACRAFAIACVCRAFSRDGRPTDGRSRVTGLRLSPAAAEWAATSACAESRLRRQGTRVASLAMPAADRHRARDSSPVAPPGARTAM